jgi:hypothetical protein
VQGYLAPPIFVVFFFGVFWKRLNAQGCLWAMVVGFALGLFRMCVDTPVTLGLHGFENGYPQGSFLWVINNIYFQYFSVLITIVSAVVMVVVSYLTAAPDDEKIKNLTFATTTAKDRAASRDSWTKWDVAASSVVLQVILVGYGYFGGADNRAISVGITPYFMLWIFSILVAVISVAVPQWRGLGRKVFAGTIGSILGFAVAVGASKVAGLVLGGILGVVVGKFAGMGDAIFFVIALVAVPTGAVVGYANGMSYVAQRLKKSVIAPTPAK